MRTRSIERTSTANLPARVSDASDVSDKPDSSDVSDASDASSRAFSIPWRVYVYIYARVLLHGVRYARVRAVGAFEKKKWLLLALPDSRDRESNQLGVAMLVASIPSENVMVVVV